MYLYIYLFTQSPIINLVHRGDALGYLYILNYSQTINRQQQVNKSSQFRG